MKNAAFVLQTFCIIFTLTGIYIEFTYQANIGFLLLTVGSFTFAISTKLNKIAIKRENRKLRNLKNE